MSLRGEDSDGKVGQMQTVILVEASFTWPSLAATFQNRFWLLSKTCVRYRYTASQRLFGLSLQQHQQEPKKSGTTKQLLTGTHRKLL